MSEQSFSLKEGKCVGFQSQWRVKKSVSTSSEVQTSAVSVTEIESNTNTKCEIETQTEDIEPKLVREPEEMTNLAAWLNRIYPQVTREMEESSQNHFKNYRPKLDETDAKAKLIQKFDVSPQVGRGDTTAMVSAMSWNCTGNTLAVACLRGHESWCLHPGWAQLYTFDRSDKLPDTPRLKLTTSACITALAFHPKLPNILLAGSFTGDLTLWNTRYDSSSECVIVTLPGHSERVTQIRWTADGGNLATSPGYLAITSGMDGLLKMWKYTSTNNEFHCKVAYKVKPPMLARVKRESPIPEEIENKTDRGIICFDFSNFVLDMFAVAIEGGLVVQCSTLGAGQLKLLADKTPVYDPVFKYYQPHEGEVTALQFSPNRKELMLSSGTDGEIRVYMIGEDEPLQIIFLEQPLISVTFVSHVEEILCGAGSRGIIELYSMVDGRKLMDIADGDVDRKSIMHMEVNLYRMTTVAVGTINGEVQLWNIPWSVIKTT